MAYIGRDTDKISNVEVLDNITFDGSSSYTLQKNSVNFTPSSANTLLVSIDGVVQAGNFTVSGSTINFGTAVAGTSTCDFILHYGVGLITTPSDGTVTTAKLADSSVSLAKLTATGTKDATTFLRGDNTFAEVTSPGLVKLATTTISSPVSSVNFDNTVVSGYNYYQVRMSNVGVSNDGDDIGIKLSGDNGSSFGTVEATRAYGQQTNTATNYDVSSAGAYTYHLLTQDSEATESTDGHSSAIIDIFNASNSSNHKTMISHSFTKNQNGNHYGYWTVSRNQLTSAVNYIRINNENNNLDSGTFTLYGVTS